MMFDFIYRISARDNPYREKGKPDTSLATQATISNSTHFANTEIKSLAADIATDNRAKGCSL